MYIRTFKYIHLFLWLVSGVEWYGKLLCIGEVWCVFKLGPWSWAA